MIMKIINNNRGNTISDDNDNNVDNIIFPIVNDFHVGWLVDILFRICNSYEDFIADTKYPLTERKGFLS